MEHCRAAEHALVAALVVGQADPAELSGRLWPTDFADPAAGLLYATLLTAPRSSGPGPRTDLPQLLRARAALRSDGYPISELLEWVPTVPVPAHPQAWAALVVSGALARLVGQCGARLVQACEAVPADDRVAGAGRVLAFVLAQRAAVHGAARRWAELPQRWRQSLPAPGAATLRAGIAAPTAATAPAAPGAREAAATLAAERELLSGLVAAPAQLDRLPWLQAEDFSDAGSAVLFSTITHLHRSGVPVDLVTVAAALGATPAAAEAGGRAGQPPPEVAADPGELCRCLDPRTAFPGAVGFLATQIMSAAVIAAAGATGAALQRLAGAPGAAGGSGQPLLDRALQELQRVADRGQRWHEACGPERVTFRARGLTGPARAERGRGTAPTVAGEAAARPGTGRVTDRTVD